MHFFEDSIDAPLFIRQYRAAERQIITSLAVLTEATILFEGKEFASLLPAEATQLTQAHFQCLADFKPELILLGTGQAQIFPPPSLLIPVYDSRIGLEVMDTDAACRTFNVLVGEGRNVLAALFV